MSKPSFKILDRFGNTEKEIPLPSEILLKDGRKLHFHEEKKSGGTAGGFYVDAEGKKYIAKFSSYTEAKETKQKLVPRSEYYEMMLNNIFRTALGEKAAPREVVVGQYVDADTQYPCFVASAVSGFRALSTFGEEKILGYVDEEGEAQRKIERAKFHKFFPLICLVMNDDLYDDNFGIDEEGNPINIDLGLTPPFLFAQQHPNIGNVDQLASYISHHNPFGGQQFRRQFFEDVSYASVLEGVASIIENEGKIFTQIDETIRQIEKDEVVPEAEKAAIIKDFVVIKTCMEKRVSYLKENFQDDAKQLDSRREEFSKMKWKDHPKFHAVLKTSRDFERKTAAEAAIANIQGMAQILGIKSDDIFEMKDQLMAATISDEKKTALQKFAKDNWALHIAAMNSDGAMVDWLLGNDLADVTQRYMKRSHNIEHRAHTPLTIAIATYHDKQADKAETSAAKSVVASLSKRFFEQVPQAKTEGYTTNPQIIWPLRATVLSYEDYHDKHALRLQSAEPVHKNLQVLIA